jgi:hypothetical protein
MITRSTALLSLASMLAAPIDAQAQPTATRDLVVFFTLYSRTYGTANSTLDALKQGFRDLGAVR